MIIYRFQPPSKFTLSGSFLKLILHLSSQNRFPTVRRSLEDLARARLKHIGDEELIHQFRQYQQLDLLRASGLRELRNHLEGELVVAQRRRLLNLVTEDVAMMLKPSTCLEFDLSSRTPPARYSSLHPHRAIAGISLDRGDTGKSGYCMQPGVRLAWSNEDLPAINSEGGDTLNCCYSTGISVFSTSGSPYLDSALQDVINAHTRLQAKTALLLPCIYESGPVVTKDTIYVLWVSAELFIWIAVLMIFFLLDILLQIQRVQFCSMLLQPYFTAVPSRK